MQQYNKILTDVDREQLQPTIDRMWKLIPNMMARKYERANVQQAFVYQAVTDLYQSGRVLSVGCWDDTAYEMLKKEGYAIDGIDPDTKLDLRYDLHTWKSIAPYKYNIIFATSVIEHVKNDAEFLHDICSLLNIFGVGIITMDFREDYVPGDNKPVEDHRLYTSEDYSRLFLNVLRPHNCEFVDIPYLVGEPDFRYGNTMYSFSTMVFRKLP